MKTLQNIVLVGWIPLLIDGFLVVEFPNAQWNRAAGWSLMVLGSVWLLAALAHLFSFVVKFASGMIKARVLSPILIAGFAILFSSLWWLRYLPSASWSRHVPTGLLVLSLMIFLLMAASVFASLKRR
jgi:hypothetical protein